MAGAARVDGRVLCVGAALDAAIGARGGSVNHAIAFVIAIVALYRPGPMDNIPRFIACKKGDEQPDYLHPLLEHALEKTLGVPVFQEQVMKLAGQRTRSAEKQ